MSSFHIGSVNGQNVQIGDHNTQHNTQVTLQEELAKLAAAIDRHASLLTDVTAAHRALATLRIACTARPEDEQRVRRAAGELAAATAAAPAITAEITRIFGGIPR